MKQQRKHTPKRIAEATLAATERVRREYGGYPANEAGRIIEQDAVVAQTMLDLLALLTEPLWLVWSNEHRAWWGPNWSQYYWDVTAAGRYTLEEALKIARARGVERGDGINPPEFVQPSPEWLARREAAIAKAAPPAKEGQR